MKIIKSAGLLLLFVNVFFLQSNAQQKHFIYIQSENKQPFSVNVKGVTYAASDLGYLILPKLVNGTYQLSVSFPGGKYLDQKFTCNIDNNDVGYLLKNYDEKGWGLYNMQSLVITMAEGNKNKPDLVNNGATNSAFGEMLSQVVQDSTLLKTNTTAEKNQDKEVQKVDSTVSAASLDNNDGKEISNDSAASAGVVQNVTPDIGEKVDETFVEKIAEQKSSTGTDLIFVDHQHNTDDTIRIFLPSDTAAIKNEIVEQPVKEDSARQQVTANEVTQNQSTVSDSLIAKNIDSTNTFTKEVAVNDTAASDGKDLKNPFFKNDTKQEVGADTSEAAPIKANVSIVNKADCGDMISDGDMDKIKRKMIIASSDDKMLEIVDKYVQKKCITTAQVKNLSLLFLSDDGRLNFFTDVYPKVYDAGNFSSLQSLLIESFYRKKFDELLSR